MHVIPPARARARTAPGSTSRVSASASAALLQVVRDLLRPATTDCKPDGSANLASGLQIREDVSRGGKGVYVDGLAQVYVMGEADVLECLACGNANRVVSSAMTNPCHIPTACFRPLSHLPCPPHMRSAP